MWELHAPSDRQLVAMKHEIPVEKCSGKDSELPLLNKKVTLKIKLDEVF